jgi:hypothetical protein
MGQKEKPKDCLGMEEGKKTWQLDAMWDPMLHPEQEKD